MKKLLLLLMTVAVLVSALGVRVSRAKAEGYIAYEEGVYVYGKGIVFIFSATGYRNKDLKDASIYVGSDFYDLFCWVIEGGKISCNAQGGLTQFAGQTAIIYLAGQIFYVIIPYRGGAPLEEVDEPLTCPEGQVLGAYVTFYYSEGSPETYFIAGDSIEDVIATANSWVDGESIIGYEAGDLECGEEPQ